MTPNKISPKQNFIAQSKRADAHQEIVLSPQFKSACESALLEYAMTLPLGGNSPDAVRAAYQFSGAKDFLRVLLNLGDARMDHIESSNPDLTPV